MTARDKLTNEYGSQSEHWFGLLDAYRDEVSRELRHSVLAALLAGPVDEASAANPVWAHGYKAGLSVAADLLAADILAAAARTAPEPAPDGRMERVTVYLTPASSAALTRAAETTGDTKTDTINRAIQTYALMAGEVADGGRVLVQHAADTYTGTRGEPGEGQ